MFGRICKLTRSSLASHIFCIYHCSPSWKETTVWATSQSPSFTSTANGRLFSPIKLLVLTVVAAGVNQTTVSLSLDTVLDTLLHWSMKFIDMQGLINRTKIKSINDNFTVLVHNSQPYNCNLPFSKYMLSVTIDSCTQTCQCQRSDDITLQNWGLWVHCTT